MLGGFCQEEGTPCDYWSFEVLNHCDMCSSPVGLSLWVGMAAIAPRIPISKSCLSLRLSRQIFIGTTCGSSSREAKRERLSSERTEREAELLINLLMSDAIPITIRYSLKLDVKAIIQHKRDLDPLLPLKNVQCILYFFLLLWKIPNDFRCIHHIVKNARRPSIES